MEPIPEFPNLFHLGGTTESVMGKSIPSNEEQSLKLSLALKLPNHIYIVFRSYTYELFFWKETNKEITEFEWLYVCYLIEQSMTDWKYNKYSNERYSHKEDYRGLREYLSADWYLRGELILKVLNEEN